MLHFVLLLFSIRIAECSPVWARAVVFLFFFFWFNVRVFRERVSIHVCASFPLDFKDVMWDLIN